MSENVCGLNGSYESLLLHTAGCKLPLLYSSIGCVSAAVCREFMGLGCKQSVLFFLIVDSNAVIICAEHYMHL